MKRLLPKYLRRIDAMSDLWTIELGINDKIRNLGINYPKFIATPFDYNIFTIHT